MNNPSETRAILRSSTPPSEENKERLEAFLKQTYAREFTLEWEQDDSLTGGFVLQVGTDVYDWSTEGRLRQFREQMRKLKPARDTVIPLIREAMTNWTPEVVPEGVCGIIMLINGPNAVFYVANVVYLRRRLVPNGGIAVGLSPACGDGRAGRLSAVRLWRRRHVKPNFF